MQEMLTRSDMPARGSAEAKGADGVPDSSGMLIHNRMEGLKDDDERRNEQVAD